MRGPAGTPLDGNAKLHGSAGTAGTGLGDALGSRLPGCCPWLCLALAGPWTVRGWQLRERHEEPQG